jgi:hypothetical protein
MLKLNLLHLVVFSFLLLGASDGFGKGRGGGGTPTSPAGNVKNNRGADTNSFYTGDNCGLASEFGCPELTPAPTRDPTAVVEAPLPTPAQTVNDVKTPDPFYSGSNCGTAAEFGGCPPDVVAPPSVDPASATNKFTVGGAGVFRTPTLPGPSQPAAPASPVPATAPPATNPPRAAVPYGRDESMSCDQLRYAISNCDLSVDEAECRWFSDLMRTKNCPTAIQTPQQTQVDKEKQAALEDKQRECNEAAEQANNSCDVSKDSSMREVMSGADQMTRGLSNSGMYGGGMYGSSGGMMGQCGAIGNLSGAANAALLTYKSNCYTSVSTCEDKCRGTDMTNVPATPGGNNRTAGSATGIARCREAKARTAGVDQNLNGIMQSAATAQQCQQALAGSRFSNPGWNPIAGGGGGAGSQSALALACKDPNSVQCQMAMKSMGLSGTTSNGFAPGSGSGGGGSQKAGAGGDGGVNFNLGGNDGLDGGGGAPGAGETMEKVQGQSGGLPRGGGGGGAAPSTGGGSSGGSSTAANPNRGFYGGNPMMNSGNGAAPANANSAAGPGTSNNPNSPVFGKVDLSKFLPQGAQSPVRRMAGIVGPDGIACSACQPMFIAVKSAYNRHGPTMDVSP